jgi:DnaJ-class molecular chaperone
MCQVLLRLVEMINMADKTYVEQPCGYCDGTGQKEGETCIACNGNKTFMVKEPPLKCQFCKGRGYMMIGSPCRTCKGTGWMGIKKK